MMRMADDIGTIEPGKLADLVVIDGDPLSDISLVRTGVVGVVQDGRVIRDDLGLMDELRADRRGAAWRPPSPSYAGVGAPASSWTGFQYP